jgi:hypothetical protein
MEEQHSKYEDGNQSPYVEFISDTTPTSESLKPKKKKKRKKKTTNDSKHTLDDVMEDL